MKLYISSHSPDAARELAARLADVHQIISTWHVVPTEYVPVQHKCEWRKLAARNIEEINRADALVLIASEDKTAGGKFVEAGYALGAFVPVFVLGRVENGMLHAPNVKHCKTLHSLRKALSDVCE